MAQDSIPFISSSNVLAVILGGGAGTRLFPLTQDRAKPAVPLAGKYRLVDIPISNCINSGFLRMFLLTQFNSASLHRHISQSYKFDHFSGGFVEISAAQQTFTDTSWYEGTADAVRKNLVHLSNQPFEYLLILSGDQLYRMNYRTLIAEHIASKADITVGTIPVTRKDVPGFGVMRMDRDSRIIDFIEKPKDPAIQDKYRLDRGSYERMGIKDDRELFLASMGIYVFSRKAVFELLTEDYHDFGKELIPAALKTHRVCAYAFQGEWEDIGTIRAFFDCNIDLTQPKSRFDFFDMASPIFTRPLFLPASKITGGKIERSIVCEGCIVEDSEVQDSVLGLRTVLRSGCRIKRTVIMGADHFDANGGTPTLGIGRNTRIENAIIDKNVRIGDGCVITPDGKPANVDHELYYIRDGIVIIPKNRVIPPGTTI